MSDPLSETTPRLALPYLMPAQAQKHVTHNEALRMLDALVQLRLEGFDATTPPTTPTEGAAYGLADSPTDAWAGQGGRLAIWQDAAWQFLTPQPGWRAWVPHGSGPAGLGWHPMATAAAERRPAGPLGHCHRRRCQQPPVPAQPRQPAQP
ncbi:DUF2793 domain-containing protein (plasmid) [Phaeobacter sp. BS34]